MKATIYMEGLPPKNNHNLAVSNGWFSWNFMIQGSQFGLKFLGHADLFGDLHGHRTPHFEVSSRGGSRGRNQATEPEKAKSVQNEVRTLIYIYIFYPSTAAMLDL